MSEIDIMTYGQVTGTISLVIFYLSFDMSDKQYNLSVYPVSMLYMILVPIWANVAGVALFIYMTYSFFKGQNTVSSMGVGQIIYIRVCGSSLFFVSVMMICQL